MDVVLVCGKVQMKKIIEGFFGDEKSELHCFFSCGLVNDYLYREVPDLIIIDLKMFNGKGVEFLQLSKRIRPDVKIIGMSSSRLHRKQCLKLGCDGFLCSGAKSFSKKELEEELEKIFKK